MNICSCRIYIRGTCTIVHCTYMYNIVLMFCFLNYISFEHFVCKTYHLYETCMFISRKGIYAIYINQVVYMNVYLNHVHACMHENVK